MEIVLTSLVVYSNIFIDIYIENREMDSLYELYKSKYGEDPVSIIRDGFSILMHYDMQQGPDHIPLANNGTREEICEAYTPEQIDLMLSIISSQQKKTQNDVKNLLKRQVRLYISQPKGTRTDSYDNIIVNMWANKDMLIDALIKESKILYNPAILINKTNYKFVPCIVQFTREFIDRHDFIIRETYGATRKTKGYIIDIDKRQNNAPLKVERNDIIDVDTAHYTALMRGAIMNNDFSSLQI